MGSGAIGAPIVVAYGKHVVAPKQVYRQDRIGQGHEVLYVGLLGEGPWNRLLKVYLNGNLIFTVGDPPSDGSASWHPNVFVDFLPGERNQPASPLFPAEVGGLGFSSTAMLVLKIVDAAGAKLLSEDQLSGSQPSPLDIRVIAECLKVRHYDASGTALFGGSRIYSTSPAWCTVDFLLNKRYGLGFDHDEIDFPAWVEFQMWCDELIPDSFVRTGHFELPPVFDRPSSGESDPFYTVGFAFRVSSPIFVTALGRVFAPGSRGTHRVALWRADGALVAGPVAVTPAQPTAAIGRVRLDPLVTYIAGVTESAAAMEIPEAGDRWSNVRDVPSASEKIQILDARWAHGFAMPNTVARANAAYGDIVIDYDIDEGARMIKRFEMNVALTTPTDAVSALGILEQHCFFKVVEINGKYRPIFGRPRAAEFDSRWYEARSDGSADVSRPLFHFTRDVILQGTFQFDTIPAEDLPEEFVGIYRDLDDDLLRPREVRFRRPGGGRPLELNLGNMTTSQAARVTSAFARAIFDLRKRAWFKTHLAALEVTKFDAVTVSHRDPGWVFQLFEVHQITDHADGTRSFVLKEYHPSLYSDSDTQPLQSLLRTTHIDLSLPPPHVPPGSIALRSVWREQPSGTTALFVESSFALIYPAVEARIFVKAMGDNAWRDTGIDAAGAFLYGPVEEGVLLSFKYVAKNALGVSADFDSAPVASIVPSKDLPDRIKARTLLDRLSVAQVLALLDALRRLPGAAQIVSMIGNLLKNPLFILGLVFWVVLSIYQAFVRPRSNQKSVELAQSGASFSPLSPIIAQNVTEGVDENDEIIAAADFGVETHNFPPRAFQNGGIQIGFEFYDSARLDGEGRPLGQKLGEAFSPVFLPSAQQWVRKKTPKAVAPRGTRMARFLVRAGPGGYSLGGTRQVLLMRNPTLEIAVFPDQDDVVHAGVDQLLALNQAQATSSAIAPANLFDNTDLREGARGWTLHPSVSLVEKPDGRWFRLEGPIEVDGEELISRTFTSQNIDDNSFIFSAQIEIYGHIVQGQLALALEMYDADGRLIGGDESPIDPFGLGRQYVKATVPRGTVVMKAVVRRAFVHSFGFGEFGEGMDFGVGTADILIIPAGTKIDFTRFQLERALPGQETPSPYTPDRTLWDDSERLRTAIDADGSVISRIGASSGEYIEIGPRGELTVVAADGTRRAPQVRLAFYTAPFVASHGDVVPFSALQRREGGGLPPFTYPPIVILRPAVSNPSVDEIGARNISTTQFHVHVMDIVSDNVAAKTSFPGEDPVFIYNKNQSTGYQSLFNALVSTPSTSWAITDLQVTIKFTPPTGTGNPVSGTATVRVRVGVWDGATFTARASQDAMFEWTRGGQEVSKLISFSHLDMPDQRNQLWIAAYYFSDTADQSGPGGTFIKKLASNPHTSGWAYIAGGDYTGTHVLGDGRALTINVGLLGAGYVIFDTCQKLTEVPRSSITKVQVQVVFDNQQRTIDFDVYNFQTNAWETILNDVKVGQVNWEVFSNPLRYVSSSGEVRTRIRFRAGASTRIDFYAVTFFVDPALYLGSGQITQVVASNRAGDIPLSNVKMEAQIFELAGPL